MIDPDPNAPTKIVEFLIAGAVLNSIRVYSSSLVLELARFEESERPLQVWVECTGNARVISRPTSVRPDVADFADQRAGAVYKLCRLIGEEATSIRITDAGTLEMALGNCDIQLGPDELNTEVVWSVMSDSPDPNIEHRWSVTMADGNVLTAHVPAAE